MTLFFFSIAEKNIHLNHLNIMKKMNAKSVQQTASSNESVAHGKVPFMNVRQMHFCVTFFLFSFCIFKGVYFWYLTLIASEHEENCLHPKKTGAEVMLALKENDAQINEERKLFSTLIDLLSYEKIIFNGTFFGIVADKKEKPVNLRTNQVIWFHSSLRN